MTQRLQKSRLHELAGFNKGEQPILLIESGPVYSYDLAEMIQQEIRNVLQEMEMKKAKNDIYRAQSTKSASAALGFYGPGFSSFNQNNQGQRVFRGVGGSRGMLGPGFK
jgi:hypothetical protein